MKFELEGNHVVATAENVQESAFLLSLADKPLQEKQTTSGEPEKKNGRRKHKIQYSRSCPICNMTCKGAIGLGNHCRKAHGMTVAEARRVALKKKEEARGDSTQSNDSGYTTSWTPLRKLRVNVED